MALAAGTRFGSYEISDEIGAGGMGEVYRATDTELERDVAIKVLPESFSTDGDWVARFEREAKTLAALNHPNIAHIYGLERRDGAIALVMELVEGPTLADKIAEGALPADEALGIAMQIADALEAAHGQGIVHRDLKPANIKLRSDGTVKVLDFGIAKTLDIRAASGQPAAQMTTPAMTQTGVILGTAAYMSPEQARGRPIDGRTDIWAFGCVLFEMLTGQPAFAGEDVAITLARILANDTDLKSLPGMISPAVRHTIEMCLKKDERKRIADIRDVKLALEGEFGTIAAQGGAVMNVRPPLWRRALPLAATSAVAVGIGAVAVWIAMHPGPPDVNRFDYVLPEGQTLSATGRRMIALSPDGRHFAYNTGDGIYLRSMGELEARLIVGTEPPRGPLTFSPDSQSIAYRDTTGELRRISISGGAPVLIAMGLNPALGLSWERDGTILIGQRDGIYRVSANGGTPERLVEAEDSVALYGPRFLPDGDSLLFSVSPGGDWDRAHIVAQSLSTGERTVLVDGGNDARYVETGHLVYALGDGLLAVRFDPDTLTVSGGAVPLVQNVSRASNNQSGVANYDVSDDGTLVYMIGGVNVVTRSLVWVDRDGREDPISAPPRTYVNPSISPDGTRVALDIRDQDLDLWIFDLARQTMTRLTVDPGQDEFPVWSPDGRQIAFASSSSNAESSLFWRAADGTGTEELLAEAPGQIFPTSFLPDGSGILLYGTAQTSTRDDISVFRFDDENSVSPLLSTPFEESYPDVSPDGHWLAYVSNESGIDEIYVRPYPDINSGRWQVSTGGGTQPLWSSDGSELFYRTSSGVTVVAIQLEPTFYAGNPAPLFEGDYLIANGGPNYDVSRDGERFLMIKDDQDASTPPRIVIVQNWFEDLKRLATTE